MQGEVLNWSAAGDGRMPDDPDNPLVCWVCGTPVLTKGRYVDKACACSGSVLVRMTEWRRLKGVPA